MNNWPVRLLEHASYIAQWSKDTTKVGAVIVDSANSIRSVGYNGVCRNVADSPERLIRPEKYKWMQHAEANAIVNCARMGCSTNACSIYITHFPCATCSGMIINAGITSVTVLENTMTVEFKERWKQDIAISTIMFQEAAVKLLTITT